MDPCTIAAEVLAACVAEAPEPVREGDVSAEAIEPATNRQELSPSAIVHPPEPPAPSGVSWSNGIKVKMRSATHASNASYSTPDNSNAAMRDTPLSRQMPPDHLRPRVASPAIRPASGEQLFAFRVAALQRGQLYTRLLPERYRHLWQHQSTGRTTYSQWKRLLAQEADVLARSQGHNRLSILVGDSLSLWLPMEQLPRDRFWLNQSISGETTHQILSRLHYFAATRPDQIHIMAGINDLKNGASDQEIIRNTQQILMRLRQQHPQAQLVIYSILPTRLGHLPSDRIRQVNHHIAYVAHQQGAQFVNLQTTFADPQGLLRRDLTTDGLHLSQLGYTVWQTALIGL